MDRAKGTPAGLWQRSDQAPVFYVIAMKDNKDEQVNYTHINNCFNQTISEFVFCKRAATDVLKTTSIPTQFTTLYECDCDWQTSDYEPSWPLSRWLPGHDLGFFQRSDDQKTGSLRRFPTACPPCTEKVCFTCLNWLIFLLFCSKQELSMLLPNPLLSSAQRTHHSVLDTLSAGLVIPLDVVHEILGTFELPFER